MQLLWASGLLLRSTLGVFFGVTAIGLHEARADTYEWSYETQYGTDHGTEVFGSGNAGGSGSVDNNSHHFDIYEDDWQSDDQGTAAYSVNAEGGRGGNGGGSDCCDGGEGGPGGYITYIDIIGHANLTTTEDYAAGLFVTNQTGHGGHGGSSGAGGRGGTGGNGGGLGASTQPYVQIYDTDSSGSRTHSEFIVETAGENAPGVFVQAIGGYGDYAGGGTDNGASGGNGAPAPFIDLMIAPTSISTAGELSAGIELNSTGGDGGQGGQSNLGDGGRGGSGGLPNSIDASVIAAVITTLGDQSSAIIASSMGGAGGKGGTGESFGQGGSGGDGGGGGPITITIEADNRNIDISTAGDDSYGIAAFSTGGTGGASGDGKFFIDGSPGDASDSGDVTIDTTDGVGAIATSGDGSTGLNAQSIGGYGGSDSSSSGLIRFAVTGGSAGAGGVVTINNGLAVTTLGQSANALNAQSLGGGGGNGGSAFGVFFSGSGDGGNGGDGGDVTIVNAEAAAITTSNYDSTAIFAQSAGGNGGTGGAAGGLVALGGRAGNGANGGKINVTNSATIVTGADPSATADSDVCDGCSYGIYAQSLGGGGGKAGSSGGWFAVGGNGGGGGDGDTVTVTNAGAISTQLDTSAAILAHSVGGGGGTAGAAASGSLVVGAAVGGSGGNGGDGNGVWVSHSDGAGDIVTTGETSQGIVAQSIGAGGGIARYAVSADAGPAAVSIAVGGSGGGGGDGGDVTVCSGSTVAKTGECEASATDAASITTSGDASEGILAQSVGGGGGHAGTTVAASEGLASLDVGVNGSGGSGGAGANVYVYSGGDITTGGASSNAVSAQSSGGGGGSSATTVAASGVSLGDINVSVGGNSGDGGDAGNVEVEASGTIVTTGVSSDGIRAASVGRSGGHGRAAVAANGGSVGDIGVSVGSGGGDGGNAGFATIHWSGDSITTSGHQSIGLDASSIGGSGGRSGAVVNGQLGSAGNFSTTLGGSGGSGGTAGDVLVTSSGDITTSGTAAPAISALSQGGQGGRADITVAASGLTAGNLSLTHGGDGGDGGQAGNVTVTTTGGTLTTGAVNADGIFAQSLGGAGGAGGTVYEDGISTSAEVGASADVTLTVGGEGGSGASAGSVTITNAANVSTADYSASGVFAQSQGGNGGQGGTVWSGQLNVATTDSVSINASVGGSGGGGGTASAVTVTNGGEIGTQGNSSDAIFAQSVGGNGGKGGSSYNMLLNINASTDSSLTSQVTVGGSGGNGAVGGAVSVTNNATLSTAGASSAGVYAQSIGGNGGAGGAGGNLLVALGETESEGASKSLQVDVAVGGAGGTGADASTVTIQNLGSIATGGSNSYGIFAQSAGGGGGDGGTASGYTLEVTGTCSFSGSTVVSATCLNEARDSVNITYSTNVNVGGSGGAGGDGDAVTVANNGTMATAGTVSHGIFAQSVGGGGGTGGDGSDGVSAFTTNTIAADVAEVIDIATEADPYELLATFTSFDVSVGGSGGASGDGGQVEVSNTGSIATTGEVSYAILAQSVGGGGGTGGSAASSFVKSLSIGGSGGAGGDGGSVFVTGDSGSSVTTSGDAAIAILAQSVGGGGGATGSDTSVAGASVSEGLEVSLNLTLGGTDGASGDGGSITIDNTATTISTDGRGGVGLFAQSIGGGGGLGSDGMDGAGGTVTLAVDGTAAGHGGTVSVVHDGSISTGQSAADSDSVAAHGVFAQSVGGGGGYGGSVVMGPTASVGTGILSESDGGTGDGGDVSVTVTGDITTAGGSSVGIFAQSVGGGGGVFGNSDSTSDTGARVGSAGGGGAGGRVSVTFGDATAELGNHSALQTGETAAGAHAIVAQSVGGAGTATTTATTVSVAVNGSLRAPGPGSFGVFAQSLGDGMGAIAVDVTSRASVTGGADATISGAADGAAVVISGGTSSALTNAGRIDAGSSGIAVSALGTDLSIDNTGTITGSVIADSGSSLANITVLSAFEVIGVAAANSELSSTINLDNSTTGTVNSGSRLDVARFTNHGRFSPGGDGVAGTTRIAGDFSQTGTGVIAVDVAADGSTDTVHLTGTAVLDGRVEVGLIAPGTPIVGQQTQSVLMADGGLTAVDDLSVTRSAVAQYALGHSNGRALNLSYSVDFANSGILAATNDNQDRLSQHMQAIYTAGALDADIAANLIAIENAPSFASAMNQLSAEVIVDNQITTVLSAIRFADTLFSCASAGGNATYFDDGQCVFGAMGAGRLEQDRTQDNLGFDENSWRVSGGWQSAIGEDWNVGGALRYEQRAMSVNASGASSVGEHVYGGLSAKRRFGAWEFGAAAAVGFGSYDIERTPLPGAGAEGTQNHLTASMDIRAAYQFNRGDWYVTPRVDLGFQHFRSTDFNEAGTTGLRLSVSSARETYVHIQPAVEIGGEFDLSGGSKLRPHISAGLTHFLGNPQASAATRFVAAPPGVPSFQTATALDSERFELAAGIDLVTPYDMIVRADGYASLSQNSEEFGASLRVEFPF